ncbi:ABC transporter ATP-binding protein [Silvimonas amylolytica]|nr:sn-glycerol-3-phosphate ABC transporter ATP-binding protein UgpC [Silvimonas amylolytica]
MASLQLRHIGKQYDNTGPEIIKDLSMDIHDGEFVVFVGPSGCGKSTMLRMIAGLEDITSGSLMIDGVRANDIAPSQRGVAMVFQSYALYPHMTVGENMGFGLKLAGHDPQEVREIVGKAAEILQLSHLLDRKPRALSGGQRQRVAIGRAIVRKPKVFLFDEPLSNLDAALRVSMRIELARLHKELGTTMIYVTHDQVEAMTLGTRIAVFNQGTVAQMGPPVELYDRPANQFVAGFLGSPTMNFIACTPASSSRGEGASVEIGGGHRVTVPNIMLDQQGLPATLGIRPEHVRITTESEGLAARVDFVEHLGDHQVVHGKLLHTDQPVVAKVPMSVSLDDANPVVGLAFNPAACRLFDQQGVALV